MLTKELLLKILPTAAKPDEYLPCLEQAMLDAEINTPLRIAMFLAQVGLESGSFHFLEENLNYSSTKLLELFPTHYTTDLAVEHAHNPQKIANHVYANRGGNGNEASGDGWKFRGRGIVQITFKNAYRDFGLARKVDFLSNPDLLTVPEFAFLSASWFWKCHDLNKFADLGDVKGATKVINGGENGLKERQEIYDRAKKALGI